ncbi:MAG TPA: glycerophosphodiester phosphodiesterase [Massilibacterium sp.]|nr:glycerophosphodiester phosphodiesterase [Massilibacterium sp.]
MQTLIIAHRGSSKMCPENTMAAFYRALEDKSDGIELDVQLTKDQVPVVIHDETLNRTTNKKGYVTDYTWNELKRLNAGSWFHRSFTSEKIPSLEEVLQWICTKPLFLNIELKNAIIDYEGIEHAVLTLVKQYNMLERTIFSSFNHTSLVRLKQLDPFAEIAPLYNARLIEPWNYVAQFGGTGIHPAFRTLDEKSVQQFKAHGLTIRSYTVNRNTHLKKAFQWNLDAIVTDVPQVARNIRKQYQ